MKPPYGRIAETAKHGTDEQLLSLRDEIRWLGRWTDQIHDQLRMIWKCAEISISPEYWFQEGDLEVRDVVIKLRLTNEEIHTLTTLLNEDE